MPTVKGGETVSIELDGETLTQEKSTQAYLLYAILQKLERICNTLIDIAAEKKEQK